MDEKEQFDGRRFQHLQARFLSEARLESTLARNSTGGAVTGQLVADALSSIVGQYFDNDPALLRTAAELAAAGEEGLRFLRDGDPRVFADRPELVAGLEAIILADGSRPSFLVRKGAVDLASSPAGEWEAELTMATELLAQALPAVGRIDHPDAPQGFQGTGFLVAPGVVMTNRHVLQEVADPTGGGAWQFHEGVKIDFGHEYRGIGSYPPRQFRSVLYATDKYIDPAQALDHALLDLVLIELDATVEQEQTPLQIDIADDWPSPELPIYIVGYPAHPGVVYSMTLLEKLFQLTFGKKRLAPGRVMKSAGECAKWTMSHDATTLGGNSGSVVLVAGRETLAAALHYGGRRNVTNWAHVIGATLSCVGAQGKTLEQVLLQHGARFRQRTVS